MAPRGRPPKRDTRMYAAVDAMAPLGFSEKVVVAKMKELLKEYTGEYGFIELDAYAVLLEALIADQVNENHHEQKQEVAQEETSTTTNEIIESEKEGHVIVPPPGFVDILVCSSTPLPALPPPLSPKPLAAPIPPLPLPVLDAVLPLPPPPRPPSLPLPPPPPLPVMTAAFPTPETTQPRKRKPYHGCIGSDDDDDDDDDDDGNDDWKFINLQSSFGHLISPPRTPPETPLTQQALPELTSGSKNTLKRRSRWDVKPEDP